MQWLKEIPSHWEVCLLGSFAKLKTGGTPSFYLKEVEEDSVDWFTPSDFTDSFDLKEASRKLNKRNFEEAGIAYFPPNSILIIGIGGTAGKVSYNSIPCYSNQQITAIIPYRDINCVFCTMYIRSLREFLLKTAPYTTLPILNNTFLSSIKVVLPPLAEQEKIVSYLEDKTSKIDAYVADKEKELELLQELKQKTIADAVTKGLNPDAKMKDSKTSLFGQIPYHWEERKMKYCFSERSEKNHPEEPILCATQSQGVIPQSMYQNRVVVVNKGFEGLKFVKAGDFVISLRSFEGGIEYAYYQGVISAAYTILTPLNANNTDYFKFLFKSNPLIQVLQTCVTGIREGQNINYQMLGRKFLPLPPSDEQQAVVAYIEEKCEKIDKLASELQSEIDYLKEYKQRLIADCVTGQVNVSGV